MFDRIDPFAGQRPAALWVQKTYENIDHGVPYYRPRTMTTDEEEAFRHGSSALQLYMSCHVMSRHTERRLRMLIRNYIISPIQSVSASVSSSVQRRLFFPAYFLYIYSLLLPLAVKDIKADGKGTFRVIRDNLLSTFLALKSV